MPQRMTQIEKTENLARELAFIFFNRRALILWTAGLVYTMVLFVAFFWPPVYSASGSLLMKGKTMPRDPQSLETVAVRQTAIQEEDLNSELQIFRSDNVVRRAVQQLEEESEVFAEPDMSGLTGWLSRQEKNLRELMSRDAQAPPGKEAQTFAKIIKINKSLSLRIVPTSNVISVSVSWSDPHAAQQILETLMRAYLVERRTVFEPGQVREFFNTQVENYRHQLERKKGEILDLVKHRGGPDPAAALENNLVLKSSISEQLNDLEKQKIDTQSEYELINNALADSDIWYFAFIDNDVIRSLGFEVQELARELALALRSYEPESETVVALKGQLVSARSNLNREVYAILEELGARLVSLQNKIDLLSDRMGEIDASNIGLKQMQLQLESLQMETELLEFSYQTFYQRSEETSIGNRELAGGADSQVVVLARGQASPEPDFPRRLPLIVLGLLLSFLVGGTVGFVREFFDHTFKRPEDVERVTGLPVVFSIEEDST